MKDSEKRAFLSKLQELYPLLSAQQLDLILPDKSKIVSIRYPDRITVYKCLNNDELVFFSFEEPGKVHFFPTLYSLHIAPQILPSVVKIHRGVIKKVAGGADLFMPGKDIRFVYV